MHNLKIIIIGAGIGGLTAGIALQQVGFEVQLYERTTTLRPAGAGISLWSNGIKVLNQLGLGGEIAAIGGEMNRMEYRSHQNEPLSQIDLRPLFERVGQRPYPVARTDLQQMLLQACGPERVQLGKQCIGVSQDGDGVTAQFADGSVAQGDLLIGADGLRSVVREHVLGAEVSPRYAGYVNWNGLVAASPELCELDNWVLYVGEGKRASMMPVGQDTLGQPRFYYFFGVPMAQGSTTPTVQRREELARHFAGWPEPVQRLIQRLDPEQTNRLEICDIDPPEQFVQGRVLLLGDSAHATTPTLGQGGCQAIEDAWVLSQLLSEAENLESALQRYEEARQPRTAQLTLKARKRTETIYGKDMDKTNRWYEQLTQELPVDVIHALATVIEGGPLG